MIECDNGKVMMRGDLDELRKDYAIITKAMYDHVFLKYAENPHEAANIMASVIANSIINVKERE